MEEKVRIEQDGKKTTITTTDDVKEIEIIFSQYRADRVKIVFKDEKEKALDELKIAKEELIKSFIETFRKIDIDEKDN